MALVFDTSYYLQQNPDVLQAILAGTIKSAEEHFNRYGAFEGRNPNATFNTNEYLSANPDVLAAGVNGFTHYLTYGVYEGRAPSASFIKIADFDSATYMAANPDLGAAGIDTANEAYAHFVLYGQFEKRPGAPVVGEQAGATFTLTAGTDFADVAGSGRAGPPFIPTDFKFSNKNELVNGSNLTSQAADTLTDNSTSDSDTYAISANGAQALTSATSQNIENIQIDFSAYSAGNVILNVAGATNLDLDGSLSAFTAFNNLANTGITKVDGSGLTSVNNGIFIDFSGATGTIAREIIGSGAADTLIGANGADKISGGAGADFILGGAGSDILDGGDGADIIQGGSGDDTITGGAGADNLFGEAGNDTISAGAGTDIISDGSGADVVRGEGGNDTYNLTADATTDTVKFEATASGNGVDGLNGFTAGGAGVGGDKLDFSAFLGTSTAFAGLAANSIGAGSVGFNGVDSNVFRLNYDADVDTVFELTAALGNDPNDLNLGSDRKVVIMMENAANNTEAYYVETNSLGEATSVTLVGTLTGVAAANLVGYNFA